MTQYLRKYSYAWCHVLISPVLRYLKFDDLRLYMTECCANAKLQNSKLGWISYELERKTHKNIKKP